MQIEKDQFSINAERISKFSHEVLLLINFLQSKPQVKSMNIIYDDLYYTVIKNRDEKEILNDEHGNERNDYIKNDKFVILDHRIGIKPRKTFLK